MPLRLSARPNFDYLKKQAREIIAAFRARDPEIIPVLQHLRRLAGRPPEDMFAQELSLQQVQHCLAVEYGFNDWEELRTEVERQCQEIAIWRDELKHITNISGRVVQWPAKRKKQIAFINLMATCFEHNRRYSEKEVNEILLCHHTFNDPAILRRALIEYGHLERTPDCREYWKKEMTVIRPPVKENS